MVSPAKNLSCVQVIDLIDLGFDCLFASATRMMPQRMNQATEKCFTPEQFDSLWWKPIKAAFARLETAAEEQAFQVSKKDFPLQKPDPWWSSYWIFGCTLPEYSLEDAGRIVSQSSGTILHSPKNILAYHPDRFLSVGFDYAVVISAGNRFDCRLVYLHLFQFMMHAWYQLHYLEQLLSSRLPDLIVRETTSLSQINVQISKIKELRNAIQRAFVWADALTLTIWAEYVDILTAIRGAWLMDTIEQNIRRKIDYIDTLYTQSRDDILQKQNARQTGTLLALSLLSLVSILAVAANVFGFLDFDTTKQLWGLYDRLKILGGAGLLIGITSLVLIAWWKEWIGKTR